MRRNPSFALLRAAVATGLICWAMPAAADDVAGTEIAFMNGVYEDLDSNLQPIQQGSITIRVSSPNHQLTVHDNRLILTPAGDGTLTATMEADFEGRGQLIADVDSLGRFQDHVEAPRQRARVAGTVRLERAAGNYLFTVVSADPYARLEIKSGVARQVVGACRVFALLMNLPCDAIARSLSVVQVPMPEPGEQIELRADLLTGAEKAYLDRFVSGG